MQELVKWLNERTKEYDEGRPSVTDMDWDDAYFKLKQLEKESGIILPDSPTNKINYQVVNSLKKVKHNHLMLSADKTKDWNEFVDYFNSKDVVGMLKLDGLTGSAHYVNGKLIGFETRGNGIEGEDVLHNAMVISSIPKNINYLDELIIDGEIICTKENFEPFSNEYKNPRNFASGSIRLLDAKECATRNLTFVVWNVVKGLDNSVIQNFESLIKLGFTVVPYTSSLDNDAKDFLIDASNKLGYPIDGLVGRFADREYGESLGSTEHHSKALYAFKFYDEEYETTLINIDYDVSRNGELTPVAVFEPLDIEGTTCEKASLHNLSVMYDTLGSYPHKGQKVFVAKMNLIIPQITNAEKCFEKQETSIKLKTVCPICNKNTDIVVAASGVKHLMCLNPSCEGKLAQKISYYCDRKNMNVKGLSRKTIEKLIDMGWLNSISDLYKLKDYRDKWIKLAGFGVKSVDNILNAIEESKHCRLENFISSLGISLIGLNVAKEIVKYYPTWEEFKNNTSCEWSYFDGFGPEMEKSLQNFNYEEAIYIADNYLIFEETEEESKQETSQSLENLIFCVTGKVTMWKNRDELKQFITSRGGKVTDSVTSKTNYLINNDTESTSAKNKKAKELGIEILSEEKFKKIFDF